MSQNEVRQNGETIFPTFYKKKVLPLEKTKELQEMMKELKQENDENIAHEKLMLGKIREKDNKFIERLENHLERFKMDRAEKIVLDPDFLPVWSQEGKDTLDVESPITDDDTIDRLVEWLNTVTTFVDLQCDKVNEILSDWFSQMDKIANEGEPDPLIAKVEKTPVDKPVVDFENVWENASWYIGFVLVCVLNIFIYYRAEDISQCIDEGFYECAVPTMRIFCAFLRNHYLKFHNITLDYPSIALENNATDNIVQYFSKSEL